MMNINKYHLNRLIAVSLMVTVVSCASTEKNEVPKNIILLIGDGMGFQQITATEYAHGNLNTTSMPYSGTIFTHSSDGRVTDSASGATALAAGYKTDNGMLGMLPDETPVQSIAHYASELGKTTALLASSQITHATPAGFGIHHPDRDDQFIIAEKFVDSGIDMLLGSGYDYFLPEDEGGARPDDRNLISEMNEQGYVYIDDEDDLGQISGQDKVIAFLEGDALQVYPDRGEQMSKLTHAALDQLSQNPEGFFMMIEGSQIDWAGHSNDAEGMIQEMIDFDNVIGDVLEFAENDGNTLVIVTADHETGGLTLLGGESHDDVSYNYATGGHSAVQVPVYSYGPSGELFTGQYDNTEIARKMFSLWGKTIEE
ncbi:MAG: alkaline phosphatase [Balneolales bacterium]